MHVYQIIEDLGEGFKHLLWVQGGIAYVGCPEPGPQRVGSHSRRPLYMHQGQLVLDTYFHVFVRDKHLSIIQRVINAILHPVSALWVLILLPISPVKQTAAERNHCPLPCCVLDLAASIDANGQSRNLLKRETTVLPSVSCITISIKNLSSPAPPCHRAIISFP